MDSNILGVLELMTSLLLVVFAVCALAFILYIARGSSPKARTSEEFSRLLTKVDVESFTTLIDSADTEFLRRSLSPQAFKRVQRARVQAAILYLQTVASNCAILLHMAEASRTSADPSIVSAANELIKDAVQLRVYALTAIPSLYLLLLFPNRKTSQMSVAERYRRVGTTVVRFVSLSSPATTSAFAAAL